MTGEEWKKGRGKAGLTQLAAAHALAVSQPYLSQLENGLREASSELTQRATTLYKLRPIVVPLPSSVDLVAASAGELQEKLASLGYPGFEHVRSRSVNNPAEVVLSAVLSRDLDTRLVESLPWVLSEYTDMNWLWLRDRAKLNNVQNRLGYLVHLAGQASRYLSRHEDAPPVLAEWERELEDARLAKEGTLCRDSMPERERQWLRQNRPKAAAHWNLLTSLKAEQLPYVEQQ